MGSEIEMRIIRVASPFFGATLILASPRKNSSYVKLPSPLVSRELKRRRTDSSSMSSEILIFFCSSRVGLYLATSASTDSPFSIAPITSQNASVVRPSGPARSRVPMPLLKARCTQERILAAKSKSSWGLPSVSTTECCIAPMSASTRPRGLREVSLPAKWACHISATVPCDASNSLIRLPSSDLPTRLEVMNPGERWICAISSVNMSPS
mmetsp:Transcript_96459/g.141057  ORF Transcript_96459/g.141057 Transcript_96459/m.141057 type:complete len:210 (-) Transcript_96459:1033-1662(-)